MSQNKGIDVSAALTHSVSISVMVSVKVKVTVMFLEIQRTAS